MAGNSEYDTPTKQSKRSESFGSNLKVPNITLTERIGRGGFGDVYIGEHHILKTKVAVKILAANQSDPTWSARFQREAQSLSRLVHPAIVKVFSFSFLENGQAAMVMEYVEGRSLHEVVQDIGPLSAKRSVDICKQLCDALSYAHDLGIVHRDVKPSNIVIGHDDQVKLLDFGIAKLLDDSTDEYSKSSKKVSQKLTATGQFMGTPAFMSPEQCEGKSAQPASDIYSLACVLYFMLFGRNVFIGNSDAEVMLKHCKTTPKLKKLSLPDDLMEVLVKALRKDPKDRYSSCSSMLSDLSSADLGTVRKKDQKFSGKALALILVGALPLLFLGKLCMNRLEADRENESAKQQIEKFKSLYADGQREFKVKNYKSAVSFLKEAVAKDLPQRERYRRLGAYDLLLAIQKGEHDSLARVAKEMYAITEHQDFKYAPLNAEEKLRLRARVYLANAKAHRNDSPVFERFIDQASKILNAKSATVYKSLIPEQLESLSLRADYKRSQGRFEDAYELDKIAYLSIIYHGLGRDQLLEYASDGLYSCGEFRTPSKFREIHRKVMIEMIPLLDDTTYMQLPVFAGLIGASYNDDEGRELTNFARKLRAASAFKNHQDDYMVSYSVLNTYQHAVAVLKGDLSGFTPNEFAYFENETRRLLPKCRDHEELNSLIDLSAALVRDKLLSVGEQEAFRERDALVTAAPGSLWKLKLFASANDAIVRTKKSISEPIEPDMSFMIIKANAINA
jgi:serine/threonine protein kinase